MNWLARLKKTEIPPQGEATKPTKPSEMSLKGGFVGFVAPYMAPIQKTKCDPYAANDPEPMPDPDRWSWPHSQAMTGAEIDTFTARLARFTDKGLKLIDGVALADKLVTRDREADDRRLCLECTQLAGFGPWRCHQWRRAGLGQPAVPAGLERQLQRCDGFKNSFNEGV